MTGIETLNASPLSPPSQCATSESNARCVAHRRWRAMGSDAHLVVVGTDDGPSSVEEARVARLADIAVERIAELEARWSRFLPMSEISVLNREGWAVVSPDTFALIDRAITAWRATGGRFHPLQLRQLEQLGYDRPFDRLDELHRPIPGELAADAGASADPLPAGCAGIVLDRFTRTVVLPRESADGRTGTVATFDPGGIGKGFAADLVVEETLAAGASGALVNLGGDLRVDGRPPSGDCWVIEVGEAAWSSDPLAVLELQRGAVATSTPLRRRWRNDVHHLLDAGTGRPADRGPAVVTAIAGEGWWAEAAATAMAAEPCLGSGEMQSTRSGLDNVASAVVGLDGTVSLAGGFERFTRQPVDLGSHDRA